MNMFVIPRRWVCMATCAVFVAALVRASQVDKCRGLCGHGAVCRKDCSIKDCIYKCRCREDYIGLTRHGSSGYYCLYELHTYNLMTGLGAGLGSALLLAILIFVSVILVQRHRHLRSGTRGTVSDYNGHSIQQNSVTELETDSEKVKKSANSQEHITSDYLHSATYDLRPRDSLAIYEEVMEDSPRQQLGAVRGPEVPQTVSTAVLPRDTIPSYIELNGGTGIYNHANTPDMSQANMYTSLK